MGLFPIPEDIIVLSAGVGIQQELGNAFAAFAIIFFGIIISDFIIFLAGEKLGRRIFDIKFFSYFFPKDKIEKVSGIFGNHNKKIVFAGRFASGLRPVALFVAGMSKMKYGHFIITDILASLIYIPFLLFLGYRFAYDISRFIENASRFYHIIEVIIICTIVVWLIRRGLTIKKN